MTTEHPTGRYMKLIKGGHRWCSQPLKMQARGSELSQGRTTEVAEPVAVGSANADIWTGQSSVDAQSPLCA